MNIDPACIAKQYGWVELNHKKKIAYNYITQQIHDTILKSKFYKNKEKIYWPSVLENIEYEKKENVISCYKTDYIPNILRYPEFTPEQFKEALLFLYDVCNYCKKNNYFLRTHLWNVTFSNGKPILIDIRDFEILKQQNWKVIFTSHFREILDSHCPIHVSKFVKNYSNIRDRLLNSNNLEDIKNILIDIELINTNNGQWSNYYKHRLDFLRNADELNEDIYNKIKNFKGGSNDPTKSINLFKYIEDIKPNSIVEMGCNSGLYTFGASKFCNVVGIDYDLNSIQEANKINTVLKTRCTFIHLDLLKPFTAYGINGAYRFPYERFKSELLIAPAIIHHLYMACKSTDKIIEIFSKFTHKYLLIEQIPSTVNTNKLVESIKKYGFKQLSTLNSSPKPRTWILCCKNN